jgi:hypothetical protein
MATSWTPTETVKPAATLAEHASPPVFASVVRIVPAFQEHHVSAVLDLAWMLTETVQLFRVTILAVLAQEVQPITVYHASQEQYTAQLLTLVLVQELLLWN